MTSDEDYPQEKSEVIYGDENIIQSTLKICSLAKLTLDVCIDSNGPSMLLIPDHPITKANYSMKERGVKMRYITEITKENIHHCKELMKFAEVRHLDEIKGNFGVLDGMYYRASANTKASSPPPLLISNTVRAFVQQQYFFDMLWRKAIPAKQRIKEIEEGLKREFIETIQDPIEIQDLIPKVINSAAEELDVIFSTANSFNRYKKEGVIELLTQKAASGVNVRILIKSDDNDYYNMEESVKNLISKHPSNVKVQCLNKSVKTKVTTFLADTELSLVIELKDDSRDVEIEEAIGLATYSNSESTVLSNASIFETLWLSQSEVPILI